MQAKRRITVFMDEYVADQGWNLLPHYLEVEQAGDMVSQMLRELKHVLTSTEFKDLVTRLVEETSQLQLSEHSDRRPSRFQVSEI